MVARRGLVVEVAPLGRLDERLEAPAWAAERRGVRVVVRAARDRR